jgi:hypothetical protein
MTRPAIEAGATSSTYRCTSVRLSGAAIAVFAATAGNAALILAVSASAF